MDSYKVRLSGLEASEHIMCSSLVDEVTNQSSVERRVKELAKHHSDPEDCQIVAEAELAGMLRLLTFDHDLRKDVASWTKVKSRTPSERWEELGISKGSEPRIRPHPTNPLSLVNWWRS